MLQQSSATASSNELGDESYGVNSLITAHWQGYSSGGNLWPAARESHTATVVPLRNKAGALERWLYLFGGFVEEEDDRNEEAFGDLWKCKIPPGGGAGELCWEELPNYTPRWGHTTSFYCFSQTVGGVSIGSSIRSSSSGDVEKIPTLISVGGYPAENLIVSRYDIDGREWTDLVLFELQAASGSINSDNYNFNNYADTVGSDPPSAKSSFKQIQCKPAYSHTAIFDSTAGIVCFGGLRSVSECTNEVMCLLPWAAVPQHPQGIRINKPKVCGTVPCPRFGHCACAVDSQMYIYGGTSCEETERENLTEIFQLSLDIWTWSVVELAEGVPRPPCPRYLHTSVCDGYSLWYIFGGDRETTENDSDASDSLMMYVFNVQSKMWCPVVSHDGPFPQDYTGASACVVTDDNDDLVAFVFGGNQFNESLCSNEAIQLRIAHEDRLRLFKEQRVALPPLSASCQRVQNKNLGSVDRSTCHAGTVGPSTTSALGPSDLSATSVHSALLQMVHHVHQDVVSRFREFERRLDETNGRIDRLRETIDRGPTVVPPEQRVMHEMLMSEVRILREEIAAIRR